MMKNNKIALFLGLLICLCASCRKEHYNVSNVHGVNAEGELLLPVASKSFTMFDMMERFQIDSLIDISETGELSFNYYYEHFGAVSGYKLLRFKDLNYVERFSFENPYVNEQPLLTDTMLGFDKTIVFESENVHVLEALMKSGRLDFSIASNFGNLRRVILRSSDIKYPDGSDFELDTPVQSNSFGFDLEGLHYVTDTANTLTFSYVLYTTFHSTNDPELFVDITIDGRELTMQSMRGYVDTYNDRSRLDTVFNLFPDNLAGMLDVNDVVMRISERNSFPLGARLVVDTALVTGEGIMPYSIFDPMPLSVDLPPQMALAEVFSQNLNGKVSVGGGRAFATTDFIVNPAGHSEMLTVADTCSIDVRVDVELPFSFSVEEVHYLDTVNMNLSELDMPDLIESITLELTFHSTLPLNLNGCFYMYNSENETITDTLVADAQLIQASFDGQPTTTTVSIAITEERMEHVFQSNRIIMAYAMDTDARNVQLNANQKLDLFVKAKVKYDGVVEP